LWAAKNFGFFYPQTFHPPFPLVSIGERKINLRFQQKTKKLRYPLFGLAKKPDCFFEWFPLFPPSISCRPPFHEPARRQKFPADEYYKATPATHRESFVFQFFWFFTGQLNPRPLPPPRS